MPALRMFAFLPLSSLALTPCFRRSAGNCFAEAVGFGMIENRIADETKILNFRHLLEVLGIAEQILEGVNQMLSDKGVML